MDILAVIAQLCMLHPSTSGAHLSQIADFQLSCQQYYVNCVNNDRLTLSQCILRREPEESH